MVPACSIGLGDLNGRAETRMARAKRASPIGKNLARAQYVKDMLTCFVLLQTSPTGPSSFTSASLSKCVSALSETSPNALVSPLVHCAFRRHPGLAEGRR